MGNVFENQVAVVTGAGGTLCSVIAKELARRGAKVALLGRTMAKLERVAAEIAADGGTALALAADVTDAGAVEAARQAVAAQLGPCRFLLNGAGGNQTVATTTTTGFDAAELREARPEGMRGFFNLGLDAVASVVCANTLGTVIPSQVFGREMAACGRGVMLNFASMNSYRPLTRVPAYALAKAGIVNFTQWLAVYLAPAGIRVNAVAPGFFTNDRSRAILMKPEGGLSARGENVMRHTPLGRFGEAGDLLGCVLWLLNDEQAAFVTGVTVPVDGGFLAASGV
ncbi:MAG: SDR family oxidoreductase [Kiritimatiellia bacterium]|jgi:NAD(P)-dependent dehydrogenase (short-subunit alcohol dehydrogenase family)|nr:SDR family oxidoreductase [Kiritimatiellia bacterium]